MGHDVVIPVFHGKQQDSTALIPAVAHFVRFQKILVCFPCFHAFQRGEGDDIDSAIVFPGQGPCSCGQFFLLSVGQQIGVVGYHRIEGDIRFIEGENRRRGKGRAGHRQ